MRSHTAIKKLCILWVTLGLGSVVNCARPAWNEYLQKPDEWFAGEQGKQVLENILSWQDENGIWPKNEPIDKNAYAGDRKKLRGTFDNKATTDELRMLARGFRVLGDERYENAFIMGLDLILKAQYPNGGWPQYYPLRKGYYTHITFNDGAMVRLMQLMDEIAKSPDYAFVGATRQKAARKAFDKGVECILNCQIRVNGKLTVWCAQHDENNLKPAAARSYELKSLSGGESADILRLLMRLENPSPRVVDAIRAGLDWYRNSRVEGIRVESIDGKLTVIQDPNAPCHWARFYEIETNRPIFCDRDGIAKYDFSQIDQERSTSYAWYGQWGRDVLKEYDKWKKKFANLHKD